MSHSTDITSQKLRRFRVGYHIEQGFTVCVKAVSAREAEAIVRHRLNRDCDELRGSTRVHYDGAVGCATEVKP